MPVAAQTVWHGTPEESNLLVAAIARNCTCEFGPFGVRTSTCAPHKAMVEEQRFLDGLLWDRHLRERIMREEGIEEP